MLLAAVALTPLVAVAQSSDEPALSQARQRIAEVTRRLEAARHDADQAAAALSDAQEELAAAERAVNEAVAAVERQEVVVRQAGARLHQLEEESQALQAAFSQRAVSVYKSGSGMAFEVVLAAGDIDSALERSEFLRVITSADRATMERVRNAQILVSAQRQHFGAQRDRLVRMREEQEALLAEVRQLRDARAAAAAAARQEVAELADQRDDLEADVGRIERLIEARKVTPVSGSLPSTQGYGWPRCDRVTSGFGRRWGRLHAGLDINGNTGDFIAASKGGVVIFVGWQGGYGRLTLIDHGDGVVTAYAHQSEQIVADGQRVERGERIGSVGNTGRSTGSHLHFETRVNGSPVDPRRFLPASC